MFTDIRFYEKSVSGDIAKLVFRDKSKRRNTVSRGT